MEKIKRRCTVVMLINNKEANCPMIIEQCKKQLSDLNIGQLSYTPRLLHSKEYFDQVHLYIISDEEIKEGDWMFSVNVNQLEKADVSLTKMTPSQKQYWLDEIKKIIASTDPSLGLPQPSRNFIEKYISEYNKGNVIEKVMVEYEDKLSELIESVENLTTICLEDYDNEEESPYYHLLEKAISELNNYSPIAKISKDNTITISKVKDSWNREEVIELIKSSVGESHDFSRENNDIHSMNIIESRFLNAWINKNL